MRVTILANNANSLVKPTAQGLQRMLAQIGLRSTVFYYGLSSITACSEVSAGRALNTGVKGIVKCVLQEYRFYHPLRQLRQYDVLVVVNHPPNPFKKGLIARCRDKEVFTPYPDCAV